MRKFRLFQTERVYRQRIQIDENGIKFYKTVENIMGKGAISPFPTVFSTRLENLLPFSSSLNLYSANTSSSEESTICPMGKG